MITPADLIVINAALHGGTAKVRDAGLVASAAARPLTVTFGSEAFPTAEEKAAALLHSVLGNHPFVEGNKRVGWTAARVMLASHGKRPGLSEDEAFDLVIRVAASGSEVDIAEVAEALRIVPRTEGPRRGSDPPREAAGGADDGGTEHDSEHDPEAAPSRP